jgi:hypothetical protein
VTTSGKYVFLHVKNAFDRTSEIKYDQDERLRAKA